MYNNNDYIDLTCLTADINAMWQSLKPSPNYHRISLVLSKDGKGKYVITIILPDGNKGVKTGGTRNEIEGYLSGMCDTLFMFGARPK